MVEVWSISGNNSFLSGDFFILFTKQPFDSCVAFLSSGIYKNVSEDWWDYPTCETCYGGYIYLNSSSVAKYFYGKSEFALSQGAKSNPTNQDILNACEICKNDDWCQINLVIRNEL